MARPKRRGVFISDRLHADPKFVALGRQPRYGLLAQSLLPLLMAVADDQGRSPVDALWVRSKAAVGIRGLTDSIVPKVVALYAGTYCPDGPWASVYEAEGRPFIQWLDWHQQNEGLRYKEPSKYPAPDGWTGDDIKSWQDDPKVRGSRAWLDRQKPPSAAENGRSPLLRFSAVSRAVPSRAEAVPLRARSRGAEAWSPPPTPAEGQA